MSDELKPQAAIAGDMRFHALVMDVYAAEVEFAAACVSGGDAYTAFEKASIARKALVAHIDAWGARLVANTAKDAERYRHLRGAQWFKAGFAKTEANASAFHYTGELLDSLVDAQIAAAPAPALGKGDTSDENAGIQN